MIFRHQQQRTEYHNLISLAYTYVCMYSCMQCLHIFFTCFILINECMYVYVLLFIAFTPKQQLKCFIIIFSFDFEKRVQLANLAKYKKIENKSDLIFYVPSKCITKTIRRLLSIYKYIMCVWKHAKAYSYVC